MSSKTSESGRKVDFIVGGVQKAGTSVLDQYLRKHDQIEMGSRKEVHFFDREKWFNLGPVNYHQYSKFFEFEPGKVVGEATPIYFYWEPSCQRIWDYNPDIKLIFILRNPIDRAFSNWNMEFDRDREENSFSFSIRNERERSKASLPRQHRIFSYTDRGLYANQIRRFYRFFKPEQILYLKYEDFKTQQADHLSRIFEFLGVSTDSYVYEHQTVRSGSYHTELLPEDKDYLRDFFRHDVRAVEQLLDWDCSDWLD